ncbi:hypothetical protein ERJ75_001137400 [Trypanosoma vivax]|nr:hypothetical protein ERJ75_001137400 [Trypanosoma vivax]
MPFISIVCNLVQIAEVVKRDALVDKEKEFFAALNAALGVGRDDAPWQWALNSGNVGWQDRSRAIGNWSAEEKITNERLKRLQPKQHARMRRHKGFQRIQQRDGRPKDATEAIAPAPANSRGMAHDNAKESRKPQHSRSCAWLPPQSTSARGS